VLETGGVPGLDAERIYYAGQSFGGIYGTKLLAVEPGIRAGVPNVPGGAIIEIARLSPVFRPLIAISLASRVPALSNGGPGGIPALGIPGFTENIPLRDEPVRVDTVPGASAIQAVLDNTEWATMSGNPVAYAPHIRKSPLLGMDPKPVLFQFGKGDQTVPNPTTTAILRAGDLADETTYFRNDLFIAANAALPPATLNPLKNAHTFLTRITGPASGIALAAQAQMAIFLASDGTTVVDPDGAAPFFETPIVPPLPETLDFIP
jgi:dienelactone hydrolase